MTLSTALAAVLWASSLFNVAQAQSNGVTSRICNVSRSNISDIYNFLVKDGEGNDVTLEKYRGKALLIVNVATY